MRFVVCAFLFLYTQTLTQKKDYNVNAIRIVRNAFEQETKQNEYIEDIIENLHAPLFSFGVVNAKNCMSTST